MKGLRLSITFISLFVLSLFLVVGKVNAFNPTQYQYKIGTAPVAGPVVSMAFNGDRVELTGSGNFTLTPKSVTGGGTFVHKNVNGTVIGSGTWMATRLWSFSSYGTQTGLPSNFEGGHALIGVHLMPTGGGNGHDGLLWVTCKIGHFPVSATEGVKLLIMQAGIFFNAEVSGETLFIRMP